MIQKKKESPEYQSFINRLSSQRRKKVEDKLELLVPLVDLVRIITNPTISDETKLDLLSIKQDALKVILDRISEVN